MKAIENEKNELQKEHESLVNKVEKGDIAEQLNANLNVVMENVKLKHQMDDMAIQIKNLHTTLGEIGQMDKDMASENLALKQKVQELTNQIDNLKEELLVVGQTSNINDNYENDLDTIDNENPESKGIVIQSLMHQIVSLKSDISKMTKILELRNQEIQILSHNLEPSTTVTL